MTRLRIRDIAEQAGVSPATVSRYLNHHAGQMTEETKARIASVIERTGYRPRLAARNLRCNSSQVIGVILADIRNPYSSSMLEALSIAASEHGYALMTSVSSNDPVKERVALDRLIDADVDALVVNTCGGCDKAILEAHRSVPVVLLDRELMEFQTDLVTSNNAELTAGLVRNLKNAGCNRVYLITESDDSSPVRRQRAQAFSQELCISGLKGHVWEIGSDPVEMINLIERHITSSPEDLGIIAVNGLVFLRLVEALASAHDSMMRGIRVATFDDYPWNHVLFGGVTTAAQDTHGIADAILELIISRIEMRRECRDVSECSSKYIEVPGSIINRASTR